MVRTRGCIRRAGPRARDRCVASIDCEFDRRGVWVVGRQSSVVGRRSSSLCVAMRRVEAWRCAVACGERGALAVCSRAVAASSTRRCTSSSSASSSSTTTTDDIGTDVKAREMEIAIDRAGLRRALERRRQERETTTTEATPRARSGLMAYLEDAIRFAGGSIPVSEYVREALTHPEHGYYMRGDVFGAKGDFVTSPEISQVFGELVGVWAALQYEALGSPETLRVVEFGPGRGTLMADLLRGTSKFKKFSDAMSVHFIEVSPALRKIQAETLRCEDVEMTSASAGDGLRVPKNVTRDEEMKNSGSVNQSSTSASAKSPVGEARARGTSGINGASVSWHDGLESVPSGPTLVIAHEFFDALPVRQFQRTERGWCEKLVTIDSDLLETDAGAEKTATPKPEKVPGRELEMVLSPGPTPASHMLVSRRLKGVPQHIVDGLRLLELSPPSLSLWDRLAERIEQHSGAVLAIDYGEEGPLGDTLEAIKDHKFVHVLDSPGEADLSAYVDFGALRQIIDEKPNSGVTCHGPITQQQFLLSLGLIPRLEKLVENATSEAQADELIKGCERLVSDSKGDAEAKEPPGMGVRYKAMCLVSRGLPKPAGF